MIHKLDSRLLGEISTTSDMQMTPPLWQKVKRNQRTVDESERGDWKTWLKTQHSKNKDHGIQSHHFMANRKGKSGKQWQTLFSWAPKSLRMVTITMKVKDTCLGRKAMINLDSILKSKDIILLTKFYTAKAMGFYVVMYGCESWTIKKAECQRIDTFELRCWRRLLRVPCTARRSNKSILREINSEYSLEGLMLKLQYFDHLMQRADSLEKTLMLGKTEGRRRKGWQRMR